MRLFTMFCLLLFRFSLVLNAYVASSSSVAKTRTQVCSHVEAAALLQFRNSFSIDYSLKSNDCGDVAETKSWEEGSDCCSWKGVQCDHTGHVTEIDLSCGLLSGRFPFNSSLFLLKRLRGLFLSFNDFKGSKIPAEINQFGSLTYLYLDNSRFSGEIPLLVQPNKPSKLISLDLSNNLLGGTVPSWIFTLPSLTELYLHDNKLQGSIPSSISNLINLTTLDLSSNNFDVSLDAFSKLQNVQELVLSNNMLSSTRSNFTLPSLTRLALAHCNLKQFPNFIKNSTHLLELDLSNNRIEGQIPEWMWDVGINSLNYLNISHNFLVGMVKLPWGNTQIFDLGFNKFQGALPIPPSSRTEYFSLSNNFLTGEISSDICNLSILKILDVSHNNLSGMIPDCLPSSTMYLHVLNLRSNKLQGHLPSTFSEFCGLQSLNLHGNQISGTLPRSLVNCTTLQVLDVGNNNISDTFPIWLESLAELHVLVLRSNKFHGSVNSTETTLSFRGLRILDLSNNKFVGPLPVQLIESLKAMVYLEGDNSSQYMKEDYDGYGYRFSVVVTIKGQTIDLENILTIFTSIDLSNNKFAGKIPDAFGNLVALKGLNLSHNNLGGGISTSLRNLTNLEWLDLSSNELVGEIPKWYL